MRSLLVGITGAQHAVRKKGWGCLPVVGLLGSPTNSRGKESKDLERLVGVRAIRCRQGVIYYLQTIPRLLEQKKAGGKGRPQARQAGEQEESVQYAERGDDDGGGRKKGAEGQRGRY